MHIELCLGCYIPFKAGNIEETAYRTLTHWGWYEMGTIFQKTFSNGFSWMKMYEFPLKISLKFVPKGLINYIPALGQIMAWCQPDNKSLSEPMMVSSLTHICVTWPQWVNELSFLRFCDINKLDNAVYKSKVLSTFDECFGSVIDVHCYNTQQSMNLYDPYQWTNVGQSASDVPVTGDLSCHGAHLTSLYCALSSACILIRFHVSSLLVLYKFPPCVQLSICQASLAQTLSHYTVNNCGNKDKFTLLLSHCCS